MGPSGGAPRRPPRPRPRPRNPPRNPLFKPPSIDALRARSLALSGRPLACTLVNWKGPVTQKVLVNSARSAMSGDGGVPSDSVVLSEFVRSIFARKLTPGDTRNFPPITTDTETVLELAPSASSTSAPSVLVGRLRLISYLQPLDPLYFEAARRSVSLSDYDLVLKRLPAEGQ